MGCKDCMRCTDGSGCKKKKDKKEKKKEKKDKKAKKKDNA